MYMKKYHIVIFCEVAFKYANFGYLYDLVVVMNCGTRFTNHRNYKYNLECVIMSIMDRINCVFFFTLRAIYSLQVTNYTFLASCRFLRRIHLSIWYRSCLCELY